MEDYEGWTHHNGCVVCPLCKEWLIVEEYVSELLRTISAHICKKVRD